MDDTVIEIKDNLHSLNVVFVTKSVGPEIIPKGFNLQYIQSDMRI